MRTLRLALLLLALCGVASAQTVTGTIDSLSDEVILDTSGKPGAVLVFTTTDFSGTIVAEASANDGANWTESVFMMANGGTQTSLSFVGTPVTVQRFIATLAGGLVKVKVTAFASGTADIYILASNSPTIVSPNVIISTGGESATPLTEVQLRSAPLEVNCVTCSGGGGSGDGKILDGTAAGQADVVGSDPAGTEQGLVTRNIPSGTQAVSGTVAVSNLPATQPVSGPLTDSELRATPVPVSGTVGVNNFPATQPVSGSVSVNNFPATQPISGTVAVSGTVPVSGPLTDSQLRATPVPVSSGVVSVTDSLESSAFADAVTISAIGSSRVLVYTQNAFGGGGAVATPEASADGGTTWVTVPLLRVGIDDDGLVTSLTSSNWTAGSTYVFNNYGVTHFRIRVSKFGSPNSSVVTMIASGSAAPANVQTVTTQRTNTFSCTMSSTATTLTEITGCGAPGGFPYPVRRYITGIQWSSSIISTTSNFMLLRAGTGSNCGTGTVDVWRSFAAPAFSPVNPPIGSTAIPLPLGNALCFIHAGAGTRFINIQGYVAP